MVYWTIYGLYRSVYGPFMVYVLCFVYLWSEVQNPSPIVLKTNTNQKLSVGQVFIPQQSDSTLDFFSWFEPYENMPCYKYLLMPGQLLLQNLTFPYQFDKSEGRDGMSQPRSGRLEAESGMMRELFGKV